jgi:hypothetical protein
MSDEKISYRFDASDESLGARFGLIAVVAASLILGGVLTIIFWHLVAEVLPFTSKVGDRLRFMVGAAATSLVFTLPFWKAIWSRAEQLDEQRTVRGQVQKASLALGLGEVRILSCVATQHGFTVVIAVPRGLTAEHFVRSEVALAVWFRAVRVKIKPGSRADQVAIEVFVTDPLRDGARWLPIPGRVGETPAGPAVWDFERFPHGLIVGDTGSGKSSAISSLLATLGGNDAAWDWRFYFIDLKRVTFAFARGGSRVGGVATTYADAMAILEQLHEEMLKRFELMERHGVTSWLELPRHLRPKPCLLIVDETTVLLATDVPGEDVQAGKQRVAHTRALLSNLARLGRSSGQSLLICLQRPEASVLTGEMRDNLGFRVLLGSMSRDGVRMCLGSDGADSVMPGHRGTGLVQGIAGDPSTVYQLVVPLATREQVEAALGVNSRKR